MIIVITYKEKKADKVNPVYIASHGVDLETLSEIPLPQVPVEQLGARFDTQMGEFVLD